MQQPAAIFLEFLFSFDLIRTHDQMPALPGFDLLKLAAAAKTLTIRLALPTAAVVLKHDCYNHPLVMCR